MRAIDADVLKQHIDKLPALPDGNFAGNHSALKALINMQPTIEPPANCSEFPNNSDTISRQAAIDAIDKALSRTFIEPCGEMILKDLPFAQPEIIRCKDCKHFESEYGYCDYYQWNMTGSDFCSKAEKREVTT